MLENRYILDPLYGKIFFPDYLWRVIHIPELQRLREIRLCNTNSFSLIGGANINRYEHSLGTAFLAIQNDNNNINFGLTKIERKNFILAALFHDVQSPAFGHSVQNVIDSRFKHGTLLYAFDKIDQNYKYSTTDAQPIFFGRPPEINRFLTSEQIIMINNFMEGKGKLGKLINGTVDLDNIDNVYRLSYHMGLINSGDQGLELAKSLSLRDNVLTISSDKSHLVNSWIDIRKKLYNFLLQNADEFSAQCMLFDSLYLAETSDGYNGLFWKDVDFEVLKKLSEISDESKMVVSRLMIGDLYGCIGIYECPYLNVYKNITNFSIREEKSIGNDLKETSFMREMENFFAKKNILVSDPLFSIFIINDLGKTSRKIELIAYDGKEIVIGEDSRRLLIGVFIKNIDCSMTKITQKKLLKSEITETIRLYLIEKLGLSGLSSIELFSEELTQ